MTKEKGKPGETTVGPVDDRYTPELIDEFNLENDQKADQPDDPPPADPPPPQDPAATADQPPYTPNFKYNVYDQEKEFPEPLRSVVRDKDTEEFVRSLLCKADGLDEMKPRHEKIVGERDEFRNKYTDAEARLRNLQGYAKTDLEMLQTQLDIPDERLFDYVKQRLRINEMQPEERRAYEANREAKMRLHDTNQRLAQVEAQNQMMQQHYYNSIIDDAINQDQEVANFGQAFDSRDGRGAFRQEVANTGVAVYRQTGREITPQEAARITYQKYARHVSTPLPQHNQYNINQPNRGYQPPPPTLPNIPSGTVSPARPAPRSIEDIKRRAAELSVG